MDLNVEEHPCNLKQTIISTVQNGLPSSDAVITQSTQTLRHNLTAYRALNMALQQWVRLPQLWSATGRVLYPCRRRTVTATTATAASGETMHKGVMSLARDSNRCVLSSVSHLLVVSAKSSVTLT